MEQIAANIKQNTDNAIETEKIAVNAAGGLKNANESTKIISESMKDIAQKILIIKEIAFQINISIEHGR